MDLRSFLGRYASITETKPISKLMECTGGVHGLKQVLTPFELTLLGIGAIIGTGIFVITGIVAANYSGPALVVSFIISGIVCAFAALCYAEFAAMVPVAGSAYTYGYASLGEIWAWIIGWDLILEYSVSIAAVAVGWSGYMASLLTGAGVVLPPALINPPGLEGGIVNLPAIVIILAITGLLIIGVKESARVNNVIVLIKISVILLFLYLASSHINPSNWTPFMPFGWSGVFTGAAIVFFAYIGFDAVSTAAEEVKDPQKNVPIGILGSLVVATILYIAVSAVLTGIVPYYKFQNVSAPVAFALGEIGISWGSALISVGAICGITSVLIVLLYGQTRIFFAMSRDGLLPRGVPGAPPGLPHAGKSDAPRGGRHGPDRKPPAPPDHRGTGQHRDPRRLHHRIPGHHRPAQDPSRYRAALPVPVRTGPPGPLHHLVRCPHPHAPAGDPPPLRDLACPRPHCVFCL